MLNIFIGYDRAEPVAYHVLAHSLMRHASEPISITPLYLPQLERANLMWRHRDPNQSTDFTFSRFLTPYLADGNPSIFMDCDMLCRADINDLVRLVPAHKDVSVVKHDYTPCSTTKFLAQPQSAYLCKNWSSLMVFNPHRSGVRSLTPSYVNDASALDLHQFRWCGLANVGDLPPDWNHLVGEYPPNGEAKLIHFTQGGPWFPDYAKCEFADAWRAELEMAMSARN